MNRIHSVHNITNPNSIYIPVGLKHKGHKKFHVHALIDTGASLCIASKHIFPESAWQDTKKTLVAKIANGESIAITKCIENQEVEIQGMGFTIDTVYQFESGLDFIIGNNFLLKHQPTIQTNDHFILTKDKSRICIPKVREAKKIGRQDFLKDYKKNKNIKMENIAVFEEHDNEFWDAFDEECHLFFNKCQEENEIEELFEKLCSENPQDQMIKRKRFQAKIELKEEDDTIDQPPRRVNQEDTGIFKKEIDKLLSQGLIEVSKGRHSSPAFYVAKKDTTEKRLVIDYREVNGKTKMDAYKIPHKEDLLSYIGGKQYFSSIDCKSGFWQIQLHPGSREITAFSCPQGLFQWNVLPFGLKQAPGIFQRFMDETFKPYTQFCCVYIDDVLIYSDTLEQHYKDVKFVLHLCEKDGIILSKKKSVFIKQEIDYLGLTIKQGSYTLQPHVLTKISEFPSKINDKKQLQRFLGILTYAEGYIKNLSEIRKPLQTMLKDDHKWNWKESDTKYIDGIKIKILKNIPDLHFPKPNDIMIIETDASDQYWAGCLKAYIGEKTFEELKNSKGKIHKEEQLCKYTSGSFSGATLNYHSNEKELLAILKTVKKFEIHIIQKPFLIRTDNNNLTYFKKMKFDKRSARSRSRWIRWQLELAEYQYEINHIAGTDNSLPDCLTREWKPGD